MVKVRMSKEKNGRIKVNSQMKDTSESDSNFSEAKIPLSMFNLIVFKKKREVKVTY